MLSTQVCTYWQDQLVKLSSRSPAIENPFSESCWQSLWIPGVLSFPLLVCPQYTTPHSSAPSENEYLDPERKQEWVCVEIYPELLV